MRYSIRRHAITQQISRDKPAVHFAGTLIDAPDTAGAADVFERHVLGHAHSAKRLHGAIRQVMTRIIAIALVVVNTLLTPAFPYLHKNQHWGGHGPTSNATIALN